MKMIVDPYFRKSTSQFFKKGEELADEIDTTQDGCIYLRFGIGDTCAIHAILDNGAGILSRRWCVGKWDERYDLAYLLGMSDLAETEIEE